MKIYLLISNWMFNGENAVNEVVGIYDCLRKAQQSLVDNINTDLQNYPYEHLDCYGNLSAEEYNLPKLADMSYDDPEFNFDVTQFKLWDGDNEDSCEVYQSYRIEERELM